MVRQGVRILLLGGILAGWAAAQTQNIPALDETTMPAPTAPGHALIAGPHEVVDPATGQVTLRFAIPLPAGRGGDTPSFAVNYASAGAHMMEGAPTGGAFVATQFGALASDGWNYTAPILTFNEVEEAPPQYQAVLCEFATDFVLQDAAGQRHQFYLSRVGNDGLNDGHNCTNYYVQPVSDLEDDGWLATTTAENPGDQYTPPTVQVTSPDGTTMEFSSNDAAWGAVPDTAVADRHGNHITYALTPSTQALTITDSAGRTVLTTSGFAGGTDTLTAADAQWKAAWGPSSFSQTIPITGVTCPNETAAWQGTGQVIQTLTTPEGVYQFAYDTTYGVLNKITFPNNGSVSYTWGLAAMPTEAGTFQTPADSNGASNPCTGIYPNVVITDRYVRPDGVNVSEHQSFSYSTVFSGSVWSSKETVVTTTDNVAGTSWTTDYHYNQSGSSFRPANSHRQLAGQFPLETEVNTAAGLADVTQTWTPDRFDSLVTDRTVRKNGVAISEEAFSYNATGQITGEQEYDGIGGTPARQSTVTYFAFPGKNILDRPQQIQVRDGAGVLQAETDHTYDTTDGDLLSTTRWVGGSSWLTWTYSNDVYGNRLTMLDPASHHTYYDYTGASGLNAYPTTITDALGHVDTYAWNDTIGRPASHTDANGQTTSYTYADPWDRLSQVSFPDGGVTKYTYTPSSFDTQRQQDASHWMDTLVTFDGLGRAAVAATATASGQWSRVDTCYNGAGEAHNVSYPYSSASNNGAASCGAAGDTLSYDALGRPTQTLHTPDGTTFLTSYSGHAVETQDEGNGATRVTRVTQTNGLGELTAVCEVTAASDAAGNAPAGCGLDIGATGFVTAYQHDTMGNLTGVTQGSETRTFGYDRLSRLASSSNPETLGTTYVYGFDSACATPNSFPGDLVSRTDARGIRTCYQYDGLHRLTQKNYSDTTPTVTLLYDSGSVWGSTLHNYIGRLSYEHVDAGGALLSGEYFDRDAMGRVVYQGGCTPSTCGSSGFGTSYTYNYAGQPTAQGNTKGANLTAAYDLAGRELSLGSSLGGTLISALTYNALGQETGATLGNGVGELRNYDARGRTTEIEAYGGTQVIPGTPGTGSITISGSERSQTIRPCDPDLGCTLWDDGTVWGTIAGVQHSASYGQGDDQNSVAASLASSLNGTTVNATSSGDVVYISAARNGSDTNYSLSAGAQSNEGMNSFSAAASGPSLTGGTNDQIVHNQIVYHFNNVTYAPDGNLLGATDNVNGTWGYSFNALNQLTAANCSATPCNGTALAFGYDRFGNRWTSQTGNYSFNLNNRIVGWSYDAAGDTTNDGAHTYTFDGEGRLATVSGGGNTANYVYDAEGRRVHETVNGVVKEYVYGAEGQELTVVDGSQNLISGETYFDGRYLGTQTPGGFVWAHTDELGTIRARTNSGGSSVEADTNWPYGAHLSQVGTYSALHYTSKPRDSESGLDYFGGRYYTSTGGRFMTPDDGSDQDPGDPQSWNLYSYVRNNPVSFTDPSGNDCIATSNGNGNNVEVTITRGQCSKGSSGTYVDGTVDADSLTYSNGQLGYNFSNSENHTGGAGVITVAQAPNDNIAAFASALNATRPGDFIAAFAGASVLGGVATAAALPGGAAAGAAEAGADASEVAGEAGYSEGQLAQTRRVLDSKGPASVRRAIRTLEKRIAEHEGKLNSLRYKSSVETELRNFRQLLRAYKQVLGGGQ